MEVDDVVKRYVLFLKGQCDTNKEQSWKEAELRDLIDDLTDYKFTTYSEKNYFNVPMIIFIINKTIEGLENL